MVGEFKDKGYWALIIGGSSGLGLATANKLALHGLNICVLHRDPRSYMERINAEFDQIKSSGVSFLSMNIDALHVDKRTQIVDKLQSKLGKSGSIRIMVHSVAKGNLKPMISEHGNELSSTDFKQTIDAMGISLYDWAKAILKADLFAESARIVSFTSEGNSKAWKNYAAVSAAKVALEAITRNIALEFAPYGVTANCIQAGVTDTSSLRAIPGSEKIKTYTTKRNPYNRLTTPEDVANAVYLLAKDEAAWINGCIIPVDGGEHIN